MSGEHQEVKLTPPIYNIDLTNTWDTESQAEEFIKQIKKLGIYRHDLKFSGFNADDIGKQASSSEVKDVIFCSGVENLNCTFHEDDENALQYAFRYENPAIAIYDASKLREDPQFGSYGYRIKDESALIGIIRLKV